MTVPTANQQQQKNVQRHDKPPVKSVTAPAYSSGSYMIISPSHSRHPNKLTLPGHDPESAPMQYLPNTQANK
jgi:hypothetical protein